MCAEPGSSGSDGIWLWWLWLDDQSGNKRRETDAGCGLALTPRLAYLGSWTSCSRLRRLRLLTWLLGRHSAAPASTELSTLSTQPRTQPSGTRCGTTNFASAQVRHASPTEPQFDGGIAFWTHYDYKLDAENDFSPCTNCSQISPFKHTNKTAFYGFDTNCNKFCLSVRAALMRSKIELAVRQLIITLLITSFLSKNASVLNTLACFSKTRSTGCPVSSALTSVLRTSERPHHFDPHNERGTCYWNDRYRYRCDLDSLTEQRICFCTSWS